MTEDSHFSGRDSRPPRTDCVIEQDWMSYTDIEHCTWLKLYERQMEILRERACTAFVEGLEVLDLHGTGIPDFREINKRLGEKTGWEIVAVPGLVPDAVFFDHLANRRFPAGRFIRRPDQLDYLEEPDVFHDVFGHVPMLCNPEFANYMQAYGKAAQAISDPRRLERLSRLYWYTVEFGLVASPEGLRIFGAGILSSASESIFSLEDASPNRLGFNAERVMRTPYRIDDFQQVYFVVPSVGELLAAIGVDQTRSSGADAVDLPIAAVLPTDQVFTWGTQDYSKTRLRQAG